MRCNVGAHSWARHRVDLVPELVDDGFLLGQIEPEREVRVRNAVNDVAYSAEGSELWVDLNREVFRFSILGEQQRDGKEKLEHCL